MAHLILCEAGGCGVCDACIPAHLLLLPIASYTDALHPAQAGTSHNLGDNFAKAFGTQFLNEAGDLVHPQQSSWGASTRLIGGIIMTHGVRAALLSLHAASCLAPAVFHGFVVPRAPHRCGMT